MAQPHAAVTGSTTLAYCCHASGNTTCRALISAAALSLPGTEIRRTKANGAGPISYFHWAGQICATKTTGGAGTWLITDRHGTQTIAVAAGNFPTAASAAPCHRGRTQDLVGGT